MMFIPKSEGAEGVNSSFGRIMFNHMQPFEALALVASIIMPLFNIPLVAKIARRKSAGDLSLSWLFGIWGCMFLMLPWAFSTKDVVLRVFGIMNFLLFSSVVVVGLKYRHGKSV